MEDHFKKGMTEAEYDAFMGKVCKLLPTNNQAQCNTFMGSYNSVIKRYVKEKVHSKQDISGMCCGIHACPL